MAIDKCAIAREAHDYLEEDRGHWGKGSFLNDREVEMDFDDEGEAYNYLEEGHRDCAVCLVGALIYGFWATGTPILDPESHAITTEYVTLRNQLDAHVQDKTEGMFSSAISFNDDLETNYDEVVAFTKSFTEEMCR